MNRWSGPLTIALAGLFAVSLALPAHAHNAVVDRQPAPESEVTESPVTVRITTNDALLNLGDNGSGNLLQVTDESGRYFGDGCVQLGDTSLEASVALGEPGVYQVAYQFVSADGHSLSGDYTFSFAPGPDHAPAAGSASPPVCGVEPSPEPATPEPVPDAAPPVDEMPEDAPVLISPQPETEANPWLVGVGFALAAIALWVLALWLLRRPR